MSDHLISEANRHHMALRTTHPTHADIAWYVREIASANEHKDDWMAKHYAIQSECALLLNRAERAEAEVERLKARLHNGCDDERDMAISEGPGHAVCGLADELTARAERAEASLHALRLVCGTTDADKFSTWVDRANARAEKAEAELAAERAKVRLLRNSCDQICEEWGINHDANPIGAGQRMATRASRALEATEDGQ